MAKRYYCPEHPKQELIQGHDSESNTNQRLDFTGVVQVPEMGYCPICQEWYFLRDAVERESDNG